MLKLIKNQNGLSLLDTVTSMACLSFLVYISTNFFLASQKTTSNLYAVNVRDKLLTTIKTVARIPASYRASLSHQGNSALRDCLFPLFVFDKDDEGDCEGGVKTEFNLYGPLVFSGGGGGGISLSGKLAGTFLNPALFDRFGVASSSDNNASAQFITKAWVQSICPPKTLGALPETKCDIAEVVELTYELKVINTPTDRYAINLAPMKETILLSAKQISGREPAIDPIVIPPPPPYTGPPPTVPPPIRCIGDTIAIGPRQCACPPGQTLIQPRRGRCAPISQ